MARMLAANVPDGLIYGLAPVIVGALLSFMGFLVLRIGRHETELAVHQRRLDELEADIGQLRPPPYDQGRRGT